MKNLLLILIFIPFALVSCHPAEDDFSGDDGETAHIYVPYGNTVVLLYHEMLPGDQEPLENPYITTNTDKFARDIEAFLALGYEPLSLEDMYMNRHNPEGRYFVITFDDGYLTNYTMAFPVLEKYGVHADIFINTDNEYMEHHFSFAQAREMEASGLVDIHSHFPQHVDVREMPEELFLSELERSFDVLSEKLGERKHRFFAYPYGYYTEGTYYTAISAGVCLQFVQSPGGDPGLFFIYRTNVAYYDDIAVLLENAYMN